MKTNTSRKKTILGISCLCGCLLLIVVFLWPSSETLFSPFDGNPEDEKIMGQLNKEKVGMEDQRMIRIIREHFIEPPSAEPYYLDHPEKLDFSNGQAPFVDNRLGFMVRFILFDDTLLKY